MKIDLKCPNTGKLCSKMWNLARKLILYKRWLFTATSKLNNKNIDDVQKTVNINVSILDNKEYQKAFKESVQSINQKRFKEDHKQILMNMFKNNINGIARINTFINLTDSKEFKKLIGCSKETILPMFGNKIYKKFIHYYKKKQQSNNLAHFYLNYI